MLREIKNKLAGNRKILEKEIDLPEIIEFLEKAYIISSPDYPYRSRMDLNGIVNQTQVNNGVAKFAKQRYINSLDVHNAIELLKEIKENNDRFGPAFKDTKGRLEVYQKNKPLKCTLDHNLNIAYLKYYRSNSFTDGDDIVKVNLNCTYLTKINKTKA